MGAVSKVGVKYLLFSIYTLSLAPF